MANDHYEVCEDKKKYCYLGKFYEGDVGSQKQIDERMEDESHKDRLNNGVGVMQMLRLCAFMRRCKPVAVKTLNESDIYEIEDILEWTRDELC